MVVRSEREEKKLQKLIEVMLEMTDASTVEELWELLFKGALLLVDGDIVKSGVRGELSSVLALV